MRIGPQGEDAQNLPELDRHTVRNGAAALSNLEIDEGFQGLKNFGFEMDEAILQEIYSLNNYDQEATINVPPPTCLETTSHHTN